MSRPLYALVTGGDGHTVVRSQNPKFTETKNGSGRFLQNAAQSKDVEDCARESQVLPAVLATVNGITITPRDLENATGDSVRNLQKQVTEARKRELDLLINSKLLAIEAKKRGVSTTKLLEQEVVAKVKAPTQAEAQTFYDRNKARIQGDFNTVKDDVLSYLLEERQRAEARKLRMDCAPPATRLLTLRRLRHRATSRNAFRLWQPSMARISRPVTLQIRLSL